MSIDLYIIIDLSYTIIPTNIYIGKTKQIPEISKCFVSKKQQSLSRKKKHFYRI
jgi:hypothetical protein